MEGAEQNFHDRPQPFKCMEKITITITCEQKERRKQQHGQ